MAVLPNRPLRVRQVFAVVDCGDVVNTDSAAAQVEGGIIFGLSAAMVGEITIAEGRVVQSNFRDHQMIRLADAPRISAEFIRTDAPPGGLGEPCVPPIAPQLPMPYSRRLEYGCGIFRSRIILSRGARPDGDNPRRRGRLDAARGRTSKEKSHEARRRHRVRRGSRRFSDPSDSSVGSGSSALGDNERLDAVREPRVAVAAAREDHAAEPVAAGAFAPPAPARGGGAGRGAATNPFANVPAFCRVAATLTPTGDSDIKVEVWLPASDWNGKYQAVGNGGWAGVDLVPRDGDAVPPRLCDREHRHRAHAAAPADFALGHPEKLIDFGYRAMHEMTRSAKADRRRVLRHARRRCRTSTAARPADVRRITEAQRYPDDFDGIVAGASAWRRHAHARVARGGQPAHQPHAPTSVHPAGQATR